MKYIVILTAFLFFSCSSSKIKIVDFKEDKNSKYFKKPDSIFIVQSKIIPTAYKGFKYPYMHVNGYKDYEISTSKFLKEGKFKNSNELKFNHTYSSFYTRKSMFDKYGNWDKAIFIKGASKPYLVWENINLFKSNNKKYTIIAGGFESTNSKRDEDRIYASVFVFDENGNDCLQDKDSVLAKQIITFFSDGIKSLTNSNEFYEKFHEAY